MTLPSSPTPVTGAYCNRSNLLLGDTVIGALVDQDAYIIAAAEEINIKIGQRWQVPVTVQDTPANYTTLRFLKRMNAQLASGRLLMSLATTDENLQVHAYGSRLVNEVQAALNSLLAGTIFLPSLLLLEGPAVSPLPMLRADQDAYSGVDAFYTLTMPGGLGGPQHRKWQ